jgi:hypothetical protein
MNERIAFLKLQHPNLDYTALPDSGEYLKPFEVSHESPPGSSGHVGPAAAAPSACPPPVLCLEIHFSSHSRQSPLHEKFAPISDLWVSERSFQNYGAVLLLHLPGRRYYRK